MTVKYLIVAACVGCVSMALGQGMKPVDAIGSAEGGESGGNGSTRGPGGGQFVNWEDPHVHPMDMTPDGQLLLVVNTPDNRLEIFSIASGVPSFVRSIPVGVEPVSVRARSSTEAWVVNHISDSVSIVDLVSGNVVRTLKTKDEPCDLVFAGGVGPAATRAFVSCSQVNAVQMFELANLSLPPVSIAILGEDPRAMGVSPDGSRVFVAVFESGNRSTVLGGGSAVATTIGFPPNVVSIAAGPWGGVNPPPNDGGVFDPPINAPNPPRVSLIVKKDGLDRWMDDNGGDWTTLVSGPPVPPETQFNPSGRVPGWDLYDHDLAFIDASSLEVYYATGLMNICMAVGINPATGQVMVVGTDGTNEKRFEPNVNGTFVRVRAAMVSDRAMPGDDPTVAWNRDLNPHLEAMAYSSSTLPQSQRDLAIGDPRAIAWTGNGATAFVCGMGSNNIVVLDSTGARDDSMGPALIEVGQGPTGLVMDSVRSRLYVLNRFDATISTVDTSSHAVVATTPYFDPTPVTIRLGRPHLYDTHRTSGLGQAACASCHVDSRLDRLAWDLGDPSGVSIAVNSVTRNLGMGLPGLNTGFQPYHPMKGPMTTQTLQDIIGKEPLHWRGDRLGLEEFNGAFTGLQGDDQMLTVGQMQEFEDFLATIHFPPNAYRTFDNSLPTSLPLPGHFTTGRFAPAGQPLPNGNAVVGLASYRAQGGAALDGGTLACVTCHTLPTGAGSDYRLSGFNLVPFPVGPLGQRHLALVSQDGVTNISMKVPQTRNMYEKTGFNATQQFNTAGFGLLHDGSVDSIERFVSEPVFNVTSDQMIANLTALMLAFSGSELPQGTTNPAALEPPGPPSKDTHAAVGAQTTVITSATADTALINAMLALANANKVGVIAKGVVGAMGGAPRGWKYNGGGMFQSDIATEVHTTSQLLALAAPGNEITLTVVVAGTQVRTGIDRDLDGWFDRDEASVCASPADASDHPGSPLSLDVNGDLTIGVPDIFAFLSAWFAGSADFDHNGVTGVPDIFAYLSAWFAGC